MHVTIESTMTADTSLMVLQMWLHKPNDNEEVIIAMIYVTKSRTGNYDFRACARARGFPGSTVYFVR